ncbi:MAG: RNA methyltransferase [Bacteroidetes bacterium]|nr:RNA methyltransferase [Bacteroidota bacterium]MCH8523660.1 THUMP domain-containing protein [Balneolales bacterium]
MNTSDYFSKTLQGLEPVLQQELTELGAINAQVRKRGVAFEADDHTLYRILMYSRIALRILKPIAVGKVSNEQELYDFIKTVEWHGPLTLKTTFAIDCDTFHPEMNHNIFLSQKSKDAIVDQFRERYELRPSVSPKDPDVLINLHVGQDGTVTVSLDASGKSMNQRGYRVATGPAPLNEVLAAGLLKMSGWDPSTTLIDPMCGTGTFLIEGALMAKNKAPGLLHDGFGIKRWPGFRSILWLQIQKDARDATRKDVDWIFGSDINDRAIDSTIKNLKRARLSQNVKVRVGKVDQIYVPPERKGVIIMNPPYGERIGDMSTLRSLYPKILTHLKKYASGYKLVVFTGDKEFKNVFGLKPDRSMELLNGTIPCDYLEYSIHGS